MEPWTGQHSPLVEMIVKWIIFLAMIIGLGFVIFGLLLRSGSKPKKDDEQEGDG